MKVVNGSRPQRQRCQDVDPAISVIARRGALQFDRFELPARNLRDRSGDGAGSYRFIVISL
jgi:hypothetical protein